MYPLRRFAGVFVDALRSPKIDLLSTDTIRLDVRRGDVELARMNNGRYLTLMDLGRIALTLRAGFLRTLVKMRAAPLVTNISIRFRRSLRVGTSFDLSTRLVCWDEKYFYLEQWFDQNGQRFAHAFVKALWVSPKGPIPTRDLLSAGGFNAGSPPFPANVQAWQSADAAFN
jgi:acyl-CoA thioesterase FadM